MRALAPLLVIALATGACGAETDASSGPADSPSSSASPSSSPSPTEASNEPTPVPAGTPDCSTIWSDGVKLPRSYRGCAEGDAFVKRDVLGCSSGQRMVRYADLYYGVLGGSVHKASQPLDDNTDYQAAIARCRA